MLLWCVAVQTGTRSWRGVLHCVVRWSRGKVPRAPRAGRRPNTFWRRIDFDSIPTPAHPLYIHPSLTGKYHVPPTPPLEQTVLGARPGPAARESPSCCMPKWQPPHVWQYMLSSAMQCQGWSRDTFTLSLSLVALCATRCRR